MKALIFAPPVGTPAYEQALEQAIRKRVRARREAEQSAKAAAEARSALAVNRMRAGRRADIERLLELIRSG